MRCSNSCVSLKKKYYMGYLFLLKVVRHLDYWGEMEQEKLLLSNCFVGFMNLKKEKF